MAALALALLGTTLFMSSARAATTYTLLVSTGCARPNPVALNGAVVSGSVYAYTDPSTGIKSVSYWLDDPTQSGAATHTEGTTPYDFAGGSPTCANPWDTTKVADGTHTITQVVTPTSGSAQTYTATFTVNNTTPPSSSTASSSSASTVSSSASTASSSASTASSSASTASSSASTASSSASSASTSTSTSTSSSSASTSSSGTTPPGGSPGWGQLQPLNLDWTRGPASTAIGALLGNQLTNLRYEMNRIGLDVPDKTTTLHTKPDATVRLRNTGTTPITINSISTTGPFTLETTLTGPQVIPAGGTFDVSVLFTYCRTGCSSSTPKGVQSGTLTVNSTDPGFPTETVSLFGDWQYDAFGGNELTVQQFVNTTFGIKTVLTGPGAKYINYGNGLYAAVGDEVLSPYWTAATSGPVYVRQIIATHGPNGHEPFAWFTQGNLAGKHVFLMQAATDAQTVLPGGSSGPSAEASFSPGSAVFGFSINGTENTDPTLTDAAGLANDARHGCDVVNTQCGHHTRMYPVKNSAGKVIPNLYLLLVDSEGTNLDFQDEIYLISNITPAS
ncbi:MAG TPA: hypothetical protein VMI11_10455 [Actinomycetes bacterium]|nr:hypothetical protein [Actinomycetes bacterium]